MRASKSRKEGDIKVVGRRRKDKRDGIDWLIEDTGVYNLQINNNITSIGSDQKYYGHIIDSGHKNNFGVAQLWRKDAEDSKSKKKFK